MKTENLILLGLAGFGVYWFFFRQPPVTTNTPNLSNLNVTSPVPVNLPVISQSGSYGATLNPPPIFPVSGIGPAPIQPGGPPIPPVVYYAQ